MNPYLYRRIYAGKRSSFDGTLCEVLDILNGGGNTFECYAAGEIDDKANPLPLAGTGIAQQLVGDSPYGSPYGDTFESYTVGQLVDGVPPTDTRITSTRVGDSPYGMSYGDTFETYPVGALSDGTPPVGSNLVNFFIS